MRPTDDLAIIWITERASLRRLMSRPIRFVISVSLVILIVTTLPYVYGELSSPPDKKFMGFMHNVPDHGQYLSWFRGFQHSLLVDNHLTPEPNAPIFFNLLWWTLARMARYTGLGYAILYQILRWVAGSLFLGIVWFFLSLFLEHRLQRVVAFLLVAVASGLGWVLVILKYTLLRGKLIFPLDVYIAESNTLFCIMAYPHFALAAALIVLVFALLIVGARKGQLRYAILAGLVALILGWQHAYDLLVIWGVPVGYTTLLALRNRRIPTYWLRSILIVGLISFWPALYSVYITQASPIWKEVLAQFENAGVFTPDPFHLLILMGLPLVLTLLTFDGLVPLAEQDEGQLFIKSWFLIGFLLNYVPTDFQIHMLNGWQVPVSVLATVGLFQRVVPAIAESVSKTACPWPRGRLAWWIALGFLALTLPTNLYLVSWRFVDLGRADYPYYLYRDELAALDWLETHTSVNDVVLSSRAVGQYIPGLSGNRPFLAHWAQTLDFYDKRERVQRFFDPEVEDAERLQTLQIFEVDYVLYGPAERALGQYNPGDSPLFSATFSNSQVTIYRVNAEEAS